MMQKEKLPKLPRDWKWGIDSGRCWYAHNSILCRFLHCSKSFLISDGSLPVSSRVVIAVMRANGVL